MTSTTSDSREAGFSLIELIVAMAVTLVITGAVYGLMAGGQNAFRREPELSDRQQNIRAAMDIIMRDVANAGAGLPPFMQTFTRNLDACSSCPNGGAPMGPNSLRTDELEMITNASGMDNEPVCDSPGSSGNLVLVRGVSQIPSPMVVLVLMTDGTWAMRNVVSTSLSSTSSGNCDNGGGIKHVGLNTNSGAGDATNMNPPGSLCQTTTAGTGSLGSSPMNPACVPKEVSFAEIVHYRIRPNATDGVPELQRSTTASFGNWQTLARGIEDMQVQYTQAGAPTPVDGAPAVVAATYTTLINQVRVTLGARSEARNIQGGTTSATGGVFIRGQLTSTGSPRSTLINLSNGPIATQQWR